MELVYSPSQGQNAGDLGSDDVRADYVYMYPPRQAYRPLDPMMMKGLVVQSLLLENELNLYVHFPFCSQICAYCNLFVAGSPTADVVTAYVSALELEIASYSGLLFGKHVETIYLGGGTPSLLPPAMLKRVLQALESATGTPTEAVCEISLEVSPETVDADKLRQLHEIGINRVNLGMQTGEGPELKSIGRSYATSVTAKSVDLALREGFSNVCVDLIYGLQHQTDESWVRSLSQAISIGPQTICTYALTLRPRTGFAARGYKTISPQTLYRRYDLAVEALTRSRYAQENHVRYIRDPAGGYRQKVNHWAGQNVLGFGAGARSYMQLCDTRNGYSTRQRRGVVRDYIERAESGTPTFTDGMVVNHVERGRKRVILGLFHLSRHRYREEFGADPCDVYAVELALASAAGLVDVDDDAIRLTTKGVRHRDSIAQLFFSEEVRGRLAAYHYDD
jgi:oxygen-independent coproporphyrinogen III oxidase